MLWMLLACWGDNTYIVEGTVVKVSAADEVILDHKRIEGLGMDAMVMPFHVRDPALIAPLTPGDVVYARFEIDETGGFLTKVRVTGHTTPPVYEDPNGPGPLRPGQVLPRTPVTLADGSSTVVGEGQVRPTALTFLYTTCPMPEFCPATVQKFQAFQAAAGPDVRLLAVTIDPEKDTPDVLAAFAERSSADPSIWQFGIAGELESLALSAGLGVGREGGEITHGIRVLILDGRGGLVERYDDHGFDIDRALKQLRTGAPLGISR